MAETEIKSPAETAADEAIEKMKKEIDETDKLGESPDEEEKTDA